MSTENKKINCFISSSRDDLKIAREISSYLNNEGIEAETWDNIFYPGLTILENLQNIVSKSDFVIFIFPSEKTYLDKNRGNIFFEMGIILGMGKPLLILVRSDTRPDLPSDLSSIMYLRYEPNDLKPSLKNIGNWAARSLKNQI